MESYPSEKLRILLFEDKSVLQQAVKNLLENYGCSVLVASNFSEAVKKFDLSFDGVLTDVGLPLNGNGLDVVRYIHKNFSDSKAMIYMYSAFGVDYIKERIGSLPVNGYFRKPFSHNEIANFVQSVIERKR